MAAAITKFYKREKQSLSPLEEAVGKAFIEVENSSSTYKSDLQTIFLTSVREFEVTRGNKQGKKAILVYVPYPCLKPLQKVHKSLVVDLERKLKTSVLITAKRTILSRWLKTHKSQQRPRSRTLTSVYDSILDDLVLPSNIIGRRIRVKLDGSKFFRITLEENDKAVLAEKTDAIASIYKKLTTRDIAIDFKHEQTFHSYKKK